MLLYTDQGTILIFRIVNPIPTFFLLARLSRAYRILTTLR